MIGRNVPKPRKENQVSESNRQRSRARMENTIKDSDDADLDNPMNPAFDILGCHLDIFQFVVALPTAICSSCFSTTSHDNLILFV